MSARVEQRPQEDEAERHKLLLEVDSLKNRLKQSRRSPWRSASVIVAAFSALIALGGLANEVMKGRREATVNAQIKQTEVSGFIEAVAAKERRLDEIQKDLDKVLAKVHEVSLARATQQAVDLQLENEAKANIRWVIQGDRGARATYDRAKSKTGNKFAAVLAAQDHNGNAQDVIRRYGEQRTVTYVGELGG